ncbi:MAG: hypothetical protein JWM76_811 [Pseudonocardiales bacterium]|nr:hypothetical protein [Pseudonocardiales bacterium]
MWPAGERIRRTALNDQGTRIPQAERRGASLGSEHGDDHGFLNSNRVPGTASPVQAPHSPGAGNLAFYRAATVVDELGHPRPLDGNGDGSVRCDIGAVELSA